MTVTEIKSAVDAGKQVFWSNINYRGDQVIRPLFNSFQVQ